MATATPIRSRIFLNYRREDTAHVTGRLADELRRHFAGDQVFQDFASIEPGTDFTEAVQHGLDSCVAVLVIIGPNWLTTADHQGRRRLGLPGDWVAHEVAESLRHPEVRVFPVLVDADMPSAEELPESLRPLTRRQAFPLTSRHWSNDVGALLTYLKKVPGLSGTVRDADPSPHGRPPRRPAPKRPPKRRGSACEVSGQAQSSPTGPETGAQPDSPPPDPPCPPKPVVDEIGLWAQLPWKTLAAAGVALAVLVLVFGTYLTQRSDQGPSTKPHQEATVAGPAPAVPTYRAGESFRDCERCPEMVVVPSGTFLMGSPLADEARRQEEGPQHRVTLAYAFAVGKYEVTFDEWYACVEGGGCGSKPGDAGWGFGRQPAINVSWEEAQAYVAWLAKKTGKPYRLLSEAEWEYAARGGTATRYPWGDEPGMNRANFFGSGTSWSGQRSAPVGSFEPNQFGLHDMIGNVFEWVQDCAHRTYDGAPSDGSAWESGDCTTRVMRGGSFLNLDR